MPHSISEKFGNCHQITGYHGKYHYKTKLLGVAGLGNANPWVVSVPEPAPVREAAPAEDAAAPLDWFDPGSVPAGTLWVVGTHGGAGESTLAACRPDWAASGGRLVFHPGSSPRMVLVCKTSKHGLSSMRRALVQLRDAHFVFRLVAIALVADAKGRMPSSLAEEADAVRRLSPAGAVDFPWVESLRFEDTASPESIRVLSGPAGAIQALV